MLHIWSALDSCVRRNDEQGGSALGSGFFSSLLASYALGHTLSGDAEVRISARKLADGRVEFALQQRVGGEWGERQLPRARFFPAKSRQCQLAQLFRASSRNSARLRTNG